MLPKIDLPIVETKLPSTGEVIKYRPFTVKEEKILLVAQESSDPADQIVAIKQVVNNCLIDKDVTELAMFDLEYMMLLLRARSVDNNIIFNIKDPDTLEDVKLEVDIDSIKFLETEGHTKEVKINDNYMLLLKYPTIDEFIKISELEDNDPLITYIVMISCLDSVVSEDEVYKFANYSDKEIDEFMENTSGEVIKGIQKFFETMPKLRQELKYVNKEGNEKTFVVEGIRTFFI